MKTFLRLRSLACAALLLAAALPVTSAADSPIPTPPGPVKRLTISFDFPGGSISKFVAALPKTDSAAISIVGEPSEMAIELPAFSLRNADAMAVIQSLASLLAARDINLNVTGASPDGVVATVTRRNAAEKRTPSSNFESFQLAPYLGDQTVDDIVGAIRAAWEMDPMHEKEALRIKFHPPTSILLVSGPGYAIETAKNVLRSLRRAPEAPSLAEALAKRIQQEDTPPPAPKKK